MNLLPTYVENLVCLSRQPRHNDHEKSVYQQDTKSMTTLTRKSRQNRHTGSGKDAWRQRKFEEKKNERLQLKFNAAFFRRTANKKAALPDGFLICGIQVNVMFFQAYKWWSYAGSNRGPLECHTSINRTIY